MTISKHWCEEVREQIKDVGQELINRADEFIPDSTRLTSEVNINIELGSSYSPTITISRLTPCDTTRIRLLKKETEDK